MNARKMHIQGFEDVVVFYERLPTYNPQMEKSLIKIIAVFRIGQKTEALGSPCSLSATRQQEGKVS